MSATMTAVVAASAATSAVLGGALFAFSSFVMPGLRAMPAREAVMAMQAINVAAPRSLLMVPLLGSAAGCLAVGIHAVVAGGEPDRGLRLAGAGLGLAAFAVTAVANVPLNNSLAHVTASDQSAVGEWAAYAKTWTRWNHVRTVAAIASAVALVEALRRAG